MPEVMIFCPMKAEAKLLVSNLPHVKRIKYGYKFKYGQVIVAGGPGKEAILHAISKHYVESMIPVLFGSAGALTVDIDIGSIFTASSVKVSDNSTLSMCGFPNIKKEAFFTSVTPVISTSDRNLIMEASGCRLVEMEGYHFANFFANLCIKSYMIRIVTDTPSLRFEVPFHAKVIANSNVVAKAFVSFG